MVRKAVPRGREPGPEVGELEAALGRSHALWTRLLADLEAGFGPLAHRWSHSAKTGNWALQLKLAAKQRTLVYLVATGGHVQAAFALGEKACAAARAAALPAAVLEAIERAPRYPEGRGVRLDVRTRRDLPGVLRLAAIKRDH